MKKRVTCTCNNTSRLKNLRGKTLNLTLPGFFTKFTHHVQKFGRHVIFKSLPRSSITLLMISISSLKRGGEGVFLCNFADYLAISSMWRTGFFVVVNLCRSRNSDPKPRDRNTH